MKRTIANIILMMTAALVISGCELTDTGGLKLVPPGSVEQAAGADATLKSLAVENYAISPAFDAATLEYTLVVTSATASLAVKAIGPEGAAVTIASNGEAAVPVTGPAYSVSVDLDNSLDVNDIVAAVTSEDGQTTAEYHVRVYYLGTSASLSGLAVSLTNGSPGAISSALSPVFDPAQLTGYTVGISYATESIDITVSMPEGSGMTAMVDGWTALSGSPVPITNLPGAGASRVITISVTSQDDSVTKNYTVTVTRGTAPSTEARLDYLQLRQYTAGWYTLELGATSTSLLSDFMFTRIDGSAWSRTKYKVLISPIDDSVASMTAKVFLNNQDPDTTATPYASGSFTAGTLDFDTGSWIFVFEKDAFDTSDYPYDVHIHIIPESGPVDEVVYQVRINKSS